MIEYTRGDLLLADADALVNAVNCVGVMGRGIALQFKRQWPDNFRDYAAACKRQQVQPGKMFVHSTGAAAPAFIINFPTKRHWKQRSLLADIEAGLADLRQVISANGIQSSRSRPWAVVWAGWIGGWSNPGLNRRWRTCGACGY